MFQSCSLRRALGGGGIDSSSSKVPLGSTFKLSQHPTSSSSAASTPPKPRSPLRGSLAISLFPPQPAPVSAHKQPGPSHGSSEALQGLPAAPGGELRNAVRPTKGHKTPCILTPSLLLPPWNPLTTHSASSTPARHTLPPALLQAVSPAWNVLPTDLIQKLVLCSDYARAPFIFYSPHSLPLTTSLKYPYFFYLLFSFPLFFIRMSALRARDLF